MLAIMDGDGGLYPAGRGLGKGREWGRDWGWGWAAGT